MVTNYRIDRCVDPKAFFGACFELNNNQPASPVHFITDNEEELVVAATKITHLGRMENLNFHLSGTLRKANAAEDSAKPFSGYYNAKRVNRQGAPKEGLIGALTVITDACAPI